MNLAMRMVGIFAIASLPLLTATQAMAQCAPHAEVELRLKESFLETRRFVGITSGNIIVEIYASEESNRWTLVATKPGRTSCLVSSGHNYAQISQNLGQVAQLD